MTNPPIWTMGITPFHGSYGRIFVIPACLSRNPGKPEDGFRFPQPILQLVSWLDKLLISRSTRGKSSPVWCEERDGGGRYQWAS